MATIAVWNNEQQQYQYVACWDRRNAMLSFLKEKYGSYEQALALVSTHAIEHLGDTLDACIFDVSRDAQETYALEGTAYESSPILPLRTLLVFENERWQRHQGDTASEEKVFMASSNEEKKDQELGE